MNLKVFLDAANEAEARVQNIAAQIDDLAAAGKFEDAVAMRPQLDEARGKAKDAGLLYASMLNSTQGGVDPARRIAPNVEVITDEADQKFESAGKFFQAVKMAGMYPGREDPRLKPMKVKDATGLSEGVPADGGYLIPQEMSSGIVQRMLNTGEVLGRVSMDPVSGNNMAYNGIDETTHVGSLFGGVIGYWLAEGASISSSKPKFYQVGLKLKKVGALCYATDEQLEDTAALESWLGRTVPEVLRFYAEDAIYEGDGVGKPLGIMNSPCLVSVLRVDANEVDSTDVAKMWSRRWTGVSDYIWIINQDVLPQLTSMTVGNWPVFIPAGGLSGAPYATLYGKPVIELEYAQTLGTTGDIMLASLSQYQAIDKAGGVKAASSIHVSFATDETAFRFVYRIDGAPLWHSALTPLHGSNTVSPFVVLASASA